MINKIKIARFIVSVPQLIEGFIVLIIGVVFPCLLVFMSVSMIGWYLTLKAVLTIMLVIGAVIGWIYLYDWAEEVKREDDFRKHEELPVD